MKVFIITEAGENIGFGHLMRMIAIYQGFEERGIRPKLIINADKSVINLLGGVDYEIFNWLHDNEKLFKIVENVDILIIDSYLADKDLYERLSKTVKLPVYYDDNNRIEYSRGIVINGNIYAKDLNYPKREDITYLLGLEYLPLRKEFWDIKLPQRKEKIENVLITFGGHDFRNLTPKVLSFLIKKYPHFNYHVVLGRKTFEEIKQNNIHYYYSLNAKEMLKLMLKVDLAISAAGQTTYELARVGLPTIAIGIADNQKYNLKGWKKIGFINEEIWFYDENLLEKIERNIESSHNLKNRVFIDGQGVRRICQKIIN